MNLDKEKRMKHLKKILLALVLVTLLVSSAVTIAIAEASYTGNIEQATLHLQEAESAKGNNEYAIDELKTLHDYLLTVNPSDNGYAEIVERYNVLTMATAYLYHKDAVEAGAGSAYINKMITLCTYMQAAGVIGKEAPKMHLAYKCDGCGASVDFTNSQLFVGINDTLTCPNGCAGAKIVGDKELTYSTFEKTVNGDTLLVIGEIIDVLFSGVGTGSGYVGYYDVDAAKQAVIDFIAGIDEMTYVPVSADVYTGNVEELSAILAQVDGESDYEELRATLKTAYLYMTTTPVSPLTDDYRMAFEDYNALCDTLVVKLGEKIEEAASVADKAEIFNDFYKFIVGDENTPAIYLSESVVNAYNELRSTLLEEFEKVDEDAAKIEQLEFKAEDIVYDEGFDEFCENLEKLEALGIENAYAPYFLDKLYEMARTNFYDPSVEGYAEAVAKYSEFCFEYVKYKFVSRADALVQITDKCKVLIEFKKYIEDQPLCEAAIDAYNDLRQSILDESKVLLGKISGQKLPDYKAPEKAAPTASGDVLNSLYSTLLGSYNRYVAAVEDKAAILGEVKSAAANVYSYILSSVIDTEADYYEEFAAAFSALRESVANELFAVVDAAEGDAKLTALSGLGEYLKINPITKATVERYNALVDTLVADAGKAEALKLSNVFIETEKIFAKISADGATLQEKLDGAKAYDAYLDIKLDITDPAYDTFLENYDAMDKIVGDAIYLDILESIRTLDADELKVYLRNYLDFINSVYTQNLILSYSNAVQSTSDTLTAIIDKIESNHEDVAYFVTSHKKALECIEEFNNAESFDEKIEKFPEMRRLIDVDCRNMLFVSGSSYSTVMAAYNEALAEFEANALALLDTNLSAIVLCANLVNYGTFFAQNSFSEVVITAYNDALKTLSAQSYYKTFIESIAGEAIYAPEYNNGWTNELDAVIEMLDAAVSGETVSDDFYDAYEIIGGFEDVPRLLDFADDRFKVLLEKYEAVISKLVLEKKAEVDAAKGLVDKVAKLEAFRAFAEVYTFSSDLAEYYNVKVKNFGDEYNTASADAFQGYLTTIKRLHEILETCVVNKSLLDTNQTRKYNLYMTLISAADFKEISSYVDSYYEVDDSDSKALIKQNQIVDKINRYIKTNGVSSYSDSKLATANAELAFIKILELFDSENEQLSENERAEAVIALGADIVANAYPQNLVDIYNARYISNAADYLKATASTPASAAAEMIDFANLVTNVSKATGFETKLDAFTSLVEYCNANTFDETDLANTLEARVNSINAEIAVKTEEQKKIADGNAEISDYAKPIHKTSDHEDGKLYDSSVQGGDKKNTATMKVVSDENGNRYAQMTYTDSAVPYTEWNTSYLAGEQCFVFDFDIMSHDSLSLNLFFTGSSVGIFRAENGYLSYTINGTDEQLSGYKKDVDEPIVFTPGEWTHVTSIIDVGANTQEILIDYVSLGTRKISPNTSATPYKTVRFRTNGATYNTICYDNLIVYSGSYFRIFDKLEKMSYDEKFAYCVETFTDEDVSAPSRYNAYLEAGKLVGYITDANAEQKAIYESFDINGVKLMTHNAHMVNLESLAKEVDVSAITSSNTSTMQLKVQAVTDYIEKNRIYFDQTAQRFIEIVDLARQATEKADWLSKLQLYVSAVKKFNRAPTLTSLERYEAEIMEHYLACDLQNPDKYATAMSDPLVEKLILEMSQNPLITDIISDITIETIHSTYISKRITAQTYLENSDKIVDAIEIIGELVKNGSELTDAEYLAELLKVASENVSFVDPYLAVIREIVNKKVYDEEVDGVDKAIEIFTALDEMFFANLQAKHFGIIAEKFERYSATNSYIEKAGICTFVRNYITENNVDMSGVDGSRYMHTLETYEAELENYKRDYEAILEANTEAFVGLVKEMSANVSYKKLKPLYTEAIEKYYYNMNSDSDEVQAAILIFAEIEEKINAMEADAALFLGYAANLRATRQAQVYQALVNCSRYVDKLDSGVAGVADAIELYNEKLLEYNENITPINSEISQALDVALSFRVHSISETVLAVIKNIIYINK